MCHILQIYPLQEGERLRPLFIPACGYLSTRYLYTKRQGSIEETQLHARLCELSMRPCHIKIWGPVEETPLYTKVWALSTRPNFTPNSGHLSIKMSLTPNSWDLSTRPHFTPNSRNLSNTCQRDHFHPKLREPVDETLYTPNYGDLSMRPTSHQTLGTFRRNHSSHAPNSAWGLMDETLFTPNSGSLSTGHHFTPKSEHLSTKSLFTPDSGDFSTRPRLTPKSAELGTRPYFTQNSADETLFTPNKLWAPVDKITPNTNF